LFDKPLAALRRGEDAWPLVFDNAEAINGVGAAGALQQGNVLLIGSARGNAKLCQMVLESCFHIEPDVLLALGRLADCEDSRSELFRDRGISFPKQAHGGRL
jgi:hypothetical protein